MTRSKADCEALEQEFPVKVATVCGDLGEDPAGVMDEAIKVQPKYKWGVVYCDCVIDVVGTQRQSK